MTFKQLLKRIEATKKRVTNQRDALRELIDEATGIADSCDEAIDSLESAADSLSQFL